MVAGQMATRSGNVDNLAPGPGQCDAPGAATCQTWCKCQSGRVCLPHINVVTLSHFLSAIKSSDISELLTFVKMKIENDMFVAARNDV